MPHKDPEKLKEYKKRYYSENKEKVRKYNMLPENYKRSILNRQTPERLKQRKEYSDKYEQRPERIAQRKKYQPKYRAQPENKSKKRIWNETNPERLLISQKKHLEKLAIPFKLSAYEYKMSLQAWSKVIKKRDKACVMCGSTDRLNAHHIIHRSIEPKLSFNINNGILLCQLHHYEVHNKKY